MYQSTAMPRGLWRYWLRIHLLLGLGLGVIFALFGLTGSLLVFSDEVDAALNPELLITREDGDPVGPATVLAAVEAATAEDFQVAWLSAPRIPDGTWQAFGGPADDRFGWMTAVDPITGEVLGQRELGTGVVAFVYNLHTHFQLGAIGRDLAGMIGILMALSLLSGFAAWWSSRRQPPRSHARPRAHASARAWHRTLGIIALPLLLVTVITGIFLRLPALTNPAIEWFSPLTDPGAAVTADADSDPGDRLSLETALDRARQVFPDAPLTGIGLPRSGAPAYQFAFREAEHPRARVGRSYAWVAPGDGAILATREWAEMTAADRFRDWLYPLHSGSAFASAGRWVVFILGLAPTLLLVTGLSLWWSRRHRGNGRSSSQARSD